MVIDIHNEKHIILQGFPVKTHDKLNNTRYNTSQEEYKTQDVPVQCRLISSHSYSPHNSHRSAGHVVTCSSLLPFLSKIFNKGKGLGIHPK